MYRYGLVALLLGACAAEFGFGQGEASGTAVIEGEEVVFDGGAVTLEVDGVRHVLVSSRGYGFTCDWAAFQLRAGPSAPPRRGDYVDLIWSEELPDEVSVITADMSLFASGVALELRLDAELLFEGESSTVGALALDDGEVRFVAEDCGAF